MRVVAQMVTLVVAHGDLDGLASAAIVILYHMKREQSFKYKVVFSQPFNLHLTLGRVDYSGVERVYILDIAVEEEYWETVSQILADLARKTEVVWVDHHLSTIARKRQMESIGVKVLAAQATATASLLSEFASQSLHPEFSLELVKLAEISEASYQPQEDRLPHAVEVLMGALALDPRDDDFRHRLLETWVKKRVLVPEEAVVRFQEAEEKLAQLFRDARERVFYESPRVRVIDLRDRRVYGFAGRIASRNAAVEGKVVLVLFRIGWNTIVITARAPDGSEVNLSEVFAKVSREWGGSGGGHRYAASLRLPAATAEAALQQIIREIELSLSRHA